MTAANLASNLVYRGAFVFFMLNTIAVPVISLLVWRAALASGAHLPVNRGYLTTYFVILSYVSMATSSWLAPFLSEDIRLGRLSTWMIRPASLLHELVANNLSEKILKTVILIPMIGGLWLIFGDSVRLPTDPVRWVLFVPSLVLGAVLVFTLDVIMGSLAFWLDDTGGLIRARVLIADVLSGSIVPLAMFPVWSHGFITAQPFRFTVSFPVEILTGQLSPHAVATGFALQAGYVLAVCLAGWTVWSAGVKAYSAVGV